MSSPAEQEQEVVVVVDDEFKSANESLVSEPFNSNLSTSSQYLSPMLNRTYTTASQDSPKQEEMGEGDCLQSTSWDVQYRQKPLHFDIDIDATILARGVEGEGNLTEVDLDDVSDDKTATELSEKMASDPTRQSIKAYRRGVVPRDFLDTLSLLKEESSADLSTAGIANEIAATGATGTENERPIHIEESQGVEGSVEADNGIIVTQIPHPSSSRSKKSKKRKRIEEPNCSTSIESLDSFGSINSMFEFCESETKGEPCDPAILSTTFAETGIASDRSISPILIEESVESQDVKKGENENADDLSTAGTGIANDGYIGPIDMEESQGVKGEKEGCFSCSRCSIF